MTRLHHFLFLSVVIACVAYPLLTRRDSPAGPAENASVVQNDSPADTATLTTSAVPYHTHHSTDEPTRARVAELGEMEAQLKTRERLIPRTFQIRSDLRAFKHEAWNQVVSTNWEAYQALRAKAVEDREQRTLCTLCDSKGYMRFCVLCRDNNGKCLTCRGTGSTRPGEPCANCLGSGKCFLCYGSGRMPCLFCEDGMIVKKLPPVSREMPIKCAEPREIEAQHVQEEKERQSQTLNAVSQWIQDTPSIQATIEEEHAEIIANEPPSFWARMRDQMLLLGVCGLVFYLVRTTLQRHKEEAEIRALAGKYLADGREAARVKMPALFEMPVAPEAVEVRDVGEAEVVEDESAKRIKNRLAEFFTAAPTQLVELLTLVQELGRSTDELERQNAFKKMYEVVAGLKDQASAWELRPVWQMTSALEMLLKRLAEKTKDVTPSSIRTVASAVDVLSDLCVPGVRPDLIINPPISVLAVDDDPLCLRAVVFALQKAAMTPQVAGDGERAVTLCTSNYYDVVFMDIQMPTMDGLTACEKIRKTKKNETTPVVFVTVQSDFGTRAQSMLKGGSDLMAKPFLMFEITVKALTLAMRKRLDLAASCEREVAVRLAADTGTDKPVEEPAMAV